MSDNSRIGLPEDKPILDQLQEALERKFKQEEVFIQTEITNEDVTNVLSHQESLLDEILAKQYQGREEELSQDLDELSQTVQSSENDLSR